MSNLNQCNFIGRLGQEPEIRYMPNGKAACNISLAVSEKYTDKQGNKQEVTEWVRVSAFDKLAEIMGQYVKKGDALFISGKMRTRKWQNQQGQDQYTTEIIANQMQMLGGNGGNSQGQQQNQGYQNNQQSNNRQAQQQPQRQQQASSEPDFNFDDDIPFAPVGLQHPALLNCI